MCLGELFECVVYLCSMMEERVGRLVFNRFIEILKDF